MSTFNPVLSIKYFPNNKEYSIGDTINNMKVIDITDTDIILIGKRGEVFTYSRETGACLSDSKRKLPGLSELPREVIIINEVRRDDQLGVSLFYRRFFESSCEIELLRKILKEASKTYPDNLVKVIIQNSSGTYKKFLLKKPFIKVDRYGKCLDLYSVGHYYVKHENKFSVYSDTHVSNGKLTTYNTHGVSTIMCAYLKANVNLTIEVPTQEELEDFRKNEWNGEL